MKTLVLKAISSIIISLFLLSSCSESNQSGTNFKTVECSVLIDITSSNMPSLKHISSKQFLEVFQLERNKSNAGIYRQAFLTETFLNYTHQYRLQGVPSMLTSNDFDREEEIQAFEGNIKNAIDEIQTVKKERPSSSVYVPIARELIKLKSSKSDRKCLIVYSDLKENSDFLSFLAKEFKNDLVSAPEKIEAYFQNELALPDDLRGIEVFIVHETQAEDNFIFKRLSRIYTSIIEKRGGTVQVQANLIL